MRNIGPAQGIVQPRRGTGARMMSVRHARRPVGALALSAVCLTLALATYAASPLVTLWSTASALQRNDVRTLRTALDWRGVRDGLKADLGAGTPADGASVSLASVRQASATTEDDLPAFGSTFATTIVSHVVDDVMTPEHLVAMLSHGTADHGDQTGRSMLGRVQRIGFVSPTEFEAAIRLSPDADAPPVVVTMRVEKWQWKVTRIHVPEQLLDGGSGGGSGNDRT